MHWGILYSMLLFLVHQGSKAMGTCYLPLPPHNMLLLRKPDASSQISLSAYNLILIWCSYFNLSCTGAIYRVIGPLSLGLAVVSLQLGTIQMYRFFQRKEKKSIVKKLETAQVSGFPSSLPPSNHNNLAPNIVNTPNTIYQASLYLSNFLP